MENPVKKTETKTNRRRQYFIKRAFQGRFILQFSFLVILGCLAFGFAIYFYSTQTLTTAFTHSRLRVMTTADFLLPAITLIALGVTAVLSIAAAFRMLLFSHKIAGPLYRLEKTVEAVQQGKLNLKVKLRSGDQLQDFAQAMDEMVQDLRTRALAIKDQNERLKGIVLQAGEKATIPKEIVEALKDTQHKLDEALSHFQV